MAKKNVTVDISRRISNKRYYPGPAVVEEDEATALDAAGATTIDGDYSLVDPSETIVGRQASYPKTTDGAQTLLAAVDYDRIVNINVVITTSFAAGDGAAPVFDFGETDTPEKFKSNLNTGSAGAVLTYSGKLTANKALLVTATAATGTTSTGAIDVNVIAAPAT